MSRLEMSRSSKGLWQRVEALVRSTLPRQARVTRTAGRTVFVRFLGDSNDNPESQFVSTVVGVPVATMGWVFTIGGGKGVFIATGIPVLTRLGRAWGSPVGENTSFVVGSYSQGKSIWKTTLGDLIPEAKEGEWLVKLTASATMYRSVTTGGIYLFAGVNDIATWVVPRGFTQSSPYGLVVAQLGHGCTADTILEIRYGGQGTAGVTNVAAWSADVTAVRTA